jgi:hypothetical protein
MALRQKIFRRKSQEALVHSDKADAVEAKSNFPN